MLDGIRKTPATMRKTPATTADEAYLHAAIEFEHARNAYDHKKGNKAFERLFRAAKQIRLTHQDGGEKFFTSLLTYDMPHVVSFAAFCLIPLNPQLTRRTYEQLAKGPPGEVSFAAEMTLKEWKAGRLDAEWYMKQ